MLLYITLLPRYEQEHIRYQVAHNLRRLCGQHNENPTVTNKLKKNENKKIKKKLIEGKAMITRADKGIL
jgi:plastocyanin domain-containing protein